MTRFKQWLVAALLGLSVSAPAAAADNTPVSVVTSFSVLADMVRQIGGQHVNVTPLVERNSDAHTYSPSPAAAKAIATADLVVVNGLGFEGWMDRLIEASGYDGQLVIASRGVDSIPAPAHDHHDPGHEHEHDHEHHEHDHHDEVQHHHGAYDPHAWHDAANGIIYVRNIAKALAQADSAHAAIYRARSKDYIKRLKALDAGIESAIAALPEGRRTVVVPHNAFRYYGKAYGIQFLAPIGLSTAAAASAGDVAELIKTIRAQGIDAIFTENIADPRLIEQVVREADAAIGGKLYSDALSGTDGPAGTYIDMLRYNTTQITAALRNAPSHPG